MAKKYTQHKQTWFTTYEGDYVEVDKGLIYILEAIKANKIETEYSCKGGGGISAYVVAKGWNSVKFLFLVYGLYLKRAYSKDVRSTVRRFRNGQREFYIGHFKDKGSLETVCIRRTRGNYYPEGHSIEISFSITHGLRVTARWPKYASDAVFDLLNETCRIRSQK